ncbi:hypothetical protein T11_6813 [Trichinella zimbabwensis]|uniref:Uncharacterized protein n=1 Tax=Trichinella zimbabwensis TaxID=268475 RepID=A0A0V1HAK3_9BILA|nr:hypothetical protein T11_6813 [Trichinella zimbabwensis]
MRYVLENVVSFGWNSGFDEGKITSNGSLVSETEASFNKTRLKTTLVGRKIFCYKTLFSTTTIHFIAFVVFLYLAEEVKGEEEKSGAVSNSQQIFSVCQCVVPISTSQKCSESYCCRYLYLALIFRHKRTMLLVSVLDGNWIDGPYLQVVCPITKKYRPWGQSD